VLPPERFTTHPSALEGLSRDQTHLLEPGTPLAAAFPASTEEVSALLRLANERRMPLVPRGAGSGLAGGATAIDGCLILSLARMDRILEIDCDDLVAIVQPGVINAELGRAVAEVGMFYAPDPSSYEISSIGGNLATNAGGLRCLKYGVTREAVLALEVVLADGSVLRTGHRSIKGVAGYDLVSLFVGSEGTLGVITEATLRLRPAPAPSGTLLASFPTLAAAGRGVAAIAAAGILPSVMELMDHTTINAVEDWQRIGLDREAAAMLIVRSDGPAQGKTDLEAVAIACRESGARDVLQSSDALESEGLMTARRAAFPALERQGATLLEDVAVPRGRLLDLLATIERIAVEEETRIGTFGHVGDGNLHPTLVFPRGDSSASLRAQRAADRILRSTLEFGGTLSGEHGIGLLKRDLLATELGVEGLRVSKAIKAVLDPLNMLNPGKVLAIDASTEGPLQPG
jgi:glycolate oxidase